MKRYLMKIGGTQVSGNEWVPIYDPYHQTRLAEVPLCDETHVDAACATAKQALSLDFPLYERVRVLEKTAQLLEDRQEHFAQIITQESAKPLKLSLAEVGRGVETLRFAAAEARKLSGELIPMEASSVGAGKLGFAMRVPIGVVAAITPFNFPVNLVLHKLAPAIAAGCPVVLKPAPQTPISSLELLQIFEEAGLPASWITVLTDSGTEAAIPLVQHPIPQLISFTGSVRVGWGIAVQASQKKVELELGSNAPVIVDEDANIKLAVKRICRGGFGYSGQTCISVQRVWVHQSIHDVVLQQLQTAISELVLGDPQNQTTDLGPLIRSQENERILEWIAEATQQGAQVHCGAKVQNRVFEPTLMSQVPHSCRLWNEEVFGPVVILEPYDSLSEVVEELNRDTLGIHVGVFTSNLNKALDVSKKLNFGGILINEVPTFRADQQPYGGVRQSGNALEGPAYAMDAMTRLKFVSFSQDSE